MRMDRFVLLIVLGVGVARAAVPDLVVATPCIPLPIFDPPQAELQIRITPSIPTTSTDVTVTVSGSQPASNYSIYDTAVRIEGSDIWLDLYWRTYGVGLQIVMPFEHTQSLGRLDPGTYVLHVTNRGALGGDATATFMVSGIPDDVDPGPGDTDPESVGGLDLSEWLAEHGFSIREIPEPGVAVPELPGFEIVHAPFSDISSIKEGISQLRIDPASPKSSDEVSVTINGWRPATDLVVERTTLRVEGKDIYLDLYWHTQPLMPPAGNPSPGIGGMEQAQCMSMQPVPIVQYDITPYSGVPFGYTASLGKFSPGTYVLHVTNHSPMSGSASVSFIVLPSAESIGQLPGWWPALLNAP